jgi:hypothetical protein
MCDSGYGTVECGVEPTRIHPTRARSANIRLSKRIAFSGELALVLTG